MVQKANANRKFSPFKTGDFVLTPKNFQKHITLPVEGPFEILEAFPNRNTYRIKWPPGARRREWATGERMKVYKTRPPELQTKSDTVSATGGEKLKPSGQGNKEKLETGESEIRRSSRATKGVIPVRFGNFHMQFEVYI